MKRNLRISVSKEPSPCGIVSCKTITLREKLLTKLFGQKQRVTVLIPGNDVSVSIAEVVEGGACYE
jgi:hypothetical protein